MKNHRLQHSTKPQQTARRRSDRKSIAASMSCNSNGWRATTAAKVTDQFSPSTRATELPSMNVLSLAQLQFRAKLTKGRHAAPATKT